MMQLGPRGEALIKGYEKLKLIAYLPTPNDKWTIGWGHTGVEVVSGLVWTLDQAETAFLHDAGWAVLQVIRTADVLLSQEQFDALVSFTFNVGVAAEGHSTLIAFVNQRKLVDAANEFTKWNKQNGEVLPGLVARRAAERALFLEGSPTVIVTT